MTYPFAALRFAEDKNISERVYWYLCGFPVKEGDKVLAPVGSRNKLQMAVVERTLSAQEENAPYDMRLIKRAEVKYGARKYEIGDRIYVEFGGVRYDEKHYTPFGKLLLANGKPQSQDELSFLDKVFVCEGDADAPAVYESVLYGTPLLIGETGKVIFRIFQRLVGIQAPLPAEWENRLKERGGAEGFLYDIGLSREKILRIKQNLQ